MEEQFFIRQKKEETKSFLFVTGDKILGNNLSLSVSQK